MLFDLKKKNPVKIELRASDMHNSTFPLNIFSYFVQDCPYYFVQSFSKPS